MSHDSNKYSVNMTRCVLFYLLIDLTAKSGLSMRIVQTVAVYKMHTEMSNNSYTRSQEVKVRQAQARDRMVR